MQLFCSDPKRNGNFGHFPLFFVGGYWLVMRVSRKDKFVIKIWLLQKCSKLPKTGCCYFPLVLKKYKKYLPLYEVFCVGDVVAEWLARWISRSRHLCLRRGWVNVLCSLGQSTLLSLCPSLPPPPPRSMEYRKYWLDGLGRGGNDNMPPWTSFS